MQGKIALEEHIESPAVEMSTGQEPFDAAYFKDVQHRLTEYELRIKDMDATGIDRTIISLTQPGIEGIFETKKAIDAARKTNDHLADFFIANNQNRFLGFACVPLQDPKAAAAELERAVKDLGFKGVLVNGYSNIGDENTAQYLDEERVLEFWDKVNELDVPVYLHPRSPLPDQQRAYAGYPGLVGSAYAFGLENATHAIRLMLSGLFDRYPKLTVILGHMGEALPFMLPRLEHRLRHQAAGANGKHEKPPTQYFRENFYITTSGAFRTQALLDSMLEIGSDRILFSVDYPYETMQEQSTWFDNCPISENDRIKIGRTNAEKLFSLVKSENNLRG